MFQDKDYVRGVLLELAATLLRAGNAGLAGHVFALLGRADSYLGILGPGDRLLCEIGLSASMRNDLGTRRLVESLRLLDEWDAAMDGCLFLGDHALTLRTAELAFRRERRWHAALLCFACGETLLGMAAFTGDAEDGRMRIAVLRRDLPALQRLYETEACGPETRLLLAAAALGMTD